VPHWLSGFY
jgi:hypothetical protein